MNHRLLGAAVGAALAAAMLTSPAQAAPFGPTPELLVDLVPGSNDPKVGDGAVIGGTFVFAPAIPGEGREPWITDGTAGGTQRLKNIRPGAGDPEASEFTAFKGKVWFSADTGTVNGTGNELWVTDGTAGGTKQFKDLFPGFGNSSDPSAFTVVGSRMFFRATGSTSQGEEVWVTDGTPAGTTLVKDVNPTLNVSSVPGGLTRLGNRLGFIATGSGTDREAWVSDGTAAGTHRISNLNGANAGAVSNLTPLGSRIVFRGANTAGNNELFVSNGGVDDAVLVKEIAAGATASDPSNLIAYDGGVIFAASGGGGAELWGTDGTAEGTARIRDINPGDTGSGPRQFTPFKGALYFRAEREGGDGGGEELWTTRGSFATTKRVADVNTGGADSDPEDLLVAGGHLFFSADTFVGRELWVTDGTTSGTRLVYNIGLVLDDGNPVPLAALRNTVVFTADDGTHGEELWTYTAQASKISVSRKSRYSASVDSARKIKVTVKVAASGATPTGKVTLKKGSKTVGSGTLSGGRKKITLSKKLGQGTHTIKAYYAGSLAGRAATKSFTIKVTK